MARSAARTATPKSYSRAPCEQDHRSRARKIYTNARGRAVRALVVDKLCPWLPCVPKRGETTPGCLARRSCARPLLRFLILNMSMGGLWVNCRKSLHLRGVYFFYPLTLGSAPGAPSLARAQRGLCSTPTRCPLRGCPKAGYLKAVWRDFFFATIWP